MHKNLIRAGVGMIVAMSATAATAACYHVYNGRGQLVERSPGPPVNMSLHLRQTVPVKYGRGATMVFEAPAGTACTDFSTLRTARRSRSIQDNGAILDNLARLNTDPRGRLGGRDDRWLADVKF